MRPRTGAVLLVAVVLTSVGTAQTVAHAATGAPSSGSRPVVAEHRSSLELAAEAYALHEHNRQRGAGATRRGVTHGDVGPTTANAGWTDMMTVARRWADTLSFASFHHNPTYGDEYGYWSAAGENIVVHTIYPAGSSPSHGEVIAATEAMMQSWWTSGAHRRNWMDRRWDDVAIGFSLRPAPGADHWIIAAVANFRDRSGSVPSQWRSFALDGTTPPQEVDGSSRFRDVPSWHTFHDPIDALARSGITSGCGGGRFCPDAHVTRGQMAAFLDRALDLPPGTRTFGDSRGHLFEDSIAALARAGITSGCSPTRFCPDAPVTRGQMAKFLDLALGLPDGTRTFDDTHGHVFEDNIAALARAGITHGCSSTRFCPDAPVTRAQMAAFLDRAGLTD